MLTRNDSRQRTSTPQSLSFADHRRSSLSVRWPLVFMALVAFGFCLNSTAICQIQNDDWLKEGLPDTLLKPKKKAPADPDGIPRAARFQLEQKIIPSLQAGDETAFVKNMMVLVSRQPQSVIDAVEAYSIKNKLGSLKEKFSSSLIRAVSSGMPVETKSLSPSLVEFTTTGVTKLVETELAELEKHILMQDPLQLPVSWSESEMIFWDVHVWKNRFINIDRLVGFAKTIQQPLLDRAIKADDDDLIDQYRQAFNLEKRVRSIYRDLNEREAELRYEMLKRSEVTLRESKAADQRLNAAFALELSGAELDALFRKQKPGSFEREKLNDANILKECEQFLVSGRKHGKDAIEKALLLRIGAHWWLRGRYGSSTEAFGLLKPLVAMKSQEMMHGLYMPKERPEAIGYINSESGQQSTGYDRRHYFTWAIERREVIRSTNSDSYSESDTQKVGAPRELSFW